MQESDMESRKGRQAADDADAVQAAGHAQDRLSELERELDEARSKYLRTLADYQNYQRRAYQNEIEARHQGARGVLESVLSVLDHFDLALSHDTAKASADQILSGVRVIRDQLVQALGAHGVTILSPAPGDEFDPTRHEAVVQNQHVPAGLVAATLQAGYTLGERVVRPAKVAVGSGQG